MNLSDYIGQTVTVRLRNGDICTATMKNNVDNEFYPVRFNDETYTNNGFLYKDSPGDWDIIKAILSNSNSSNNNTNTVNQTPQTVSDFIALLTAVKEQYGDIVVRYASDKYEATSESCRSEFEDILVVGGIKSLIADNNDAVEEPTLVFVP
jgi:hypothetical protein